jgi:predicted nucleotidyltransferase
VFGLSDSDYRLISTLLSPLTEAGAKVWCFGSRARGDHHEFSDLDLMLESSNDLSREIGDLKEAFEESRLPIKVDLVQDRNFAEAYRSSYLEDRKLFLK